MKQIQLDLYPDIVKSVFLRADSPKAAFYKIWLEKHSECFLIKKESGTDTRILNRRSWVFKELNEAIRNFDSRLKSKTNPNRKYRKYKICQ